MAIKTVVCRDPDCPDSAERTQAPPAMVAVREMASAWIFACRRCQKEGRITARVVTKDQIGGTIGAGAPDTSRGTWTGKGPSRFRPGWTPPQGVNR